MTSSIELLKTKQADINKKILHFGSLAGWPHTLARISREFGIAAENVVHVYKDVLDLDRRLPYDNSIFCDNDAYLKKVQKTLLFLLPFSWVAACWLLM